jgi:hypothetical protein
VCKPSQDNFFSHTLVSEDLKGGVIYMSYHKYYDTCRECIGKLVEIKTNKGTVHIGIIDRVTSDKVYIRPVNETLDYGGYGYGAFGECCGFGLAATGFAFGLITSLIFLPFFF